MAEDTSFTWQIQYVLGHSSRLSKTDFEVVSVPVAQYLQDFAILNNNNNSADALEGVQNQQSKWLS